MDRDYLLPVLKQWGDPPGDRFTDEQIVQIKNEALKNLKQRMWDRAELIKNRKAQ